MTPKAVQEVYCSASVPCLTSSAISRLQFPVIITNDAIGTPAPITVRVSMDLPVESTYLLRVTNVTDDVEAVGASNYTLVGGKNILFTNTSESPLPLRATLPTPRARALHVFSVFVERSAISTSTNDEDLHFSFSVTINGQVSNIDYTNQTYSSVFRLKKSAAVVQTNDTNVTNTPDFVVPSIGFKVGYDEPVMVGLGVLIFLLFILLVAGLCTLLWLANRPPKDSSELPLNKSPENITSEVPLSPGPQ